MVTKDWRQDSNKEPFVLLYNKRQNISSGDYWSFTLSDVNYIIHVNYRYLVKLIPDVNNRYLVKYPKWTTGI